MPGTVKTPIDPAELLDEAFLENPYPLFARLRRHDPVHWNELTRGWYVTRYVDVFDLLMDDRLRAPSHEAELAVLSGTQRELAAEVRGFFARWMVLSDPPYQPRVRALLHQAFTPATVSSLAADIERRADHAVAKFRIEGADVMLDLAQPFALSVIGGLLGVAESEFANVLGWSETLMAFLNQSRLEVEQARSTLDAIEELSEYVLGTVLPRRDGLVPELLKSGLDKAQLSRAEVVATFAQLLTGGLEPMSNAMGSAVLALHAHPDQHEAVRAGEVSYRDAVEEVLRYDPPFHYTISRQASADLSVGGTTIPGGDRVVMVLASANRDERQFADAGSFNIRRGPTRHLAFGRGGHYCLGAFLARKEMEALLRTLDEKVPELRIDVRRARRNPVFGATVLGPVPVAGSGS